MLLGTREVLVDGVKAAQKAMCGDESQWLTWIRGVGKRLFGEAKGKR